MNTILGYLYAIISSIFYSIYVIPKKIAKEKTMYYTVFMTLGFTVASIIAYIIFSCMGINKENIFTPVMLIAILKGILWFLALILFLLSIDEIGISRATQYKNLKGPLGVFLTLLILQEFLLTNVFFVIIATILTFVSALLLTIKKSEQVKVSKKGIVYAVLAAIFLGFTTLLQKVITNNGYIYTQHIYTSITSLISSFIYIVYRDKNLINLANTTHKSIALAMIGGAIYYLASFFSTLSYEKIPASIASIIIQLNSVWSILIGIIIFKEINLKKNWKRIYLGIIFSILGIAMLWIAKK